MAGPVTHVVGRAPIHSALTGGAARAEADAHAACHLHARVLGTIPRGGFDEPHAEQHNPGRQEQGPPIG